MLVEPMMIATISRLKQTEEGQYKKVTEQYLVPGLTFTLAEAFIYKNIIEQKGFEGEFTIKSLNREEFDDVIKDENVDGEYWYKCKAEFTNMDEKPTKMTFYVNANTVMNANENLDKFLSEYYQDYTIKSVVETKIEDVFIEN